MLRMDKVLDFSKVGDAIEPPDLITIQTASYERFLQADAPPDKRKNEGLEALLREVFPIVSYDGQNQLEYVSYELGEPRYTTEECRQLRLSYGRPLRVRCRLVRKDKKDVVEEAIYLGDMPTMIGGGEFIINGAERVIVSQLHRSPGVDFTIEFQESDRPLHGARIIPERGSWIEMSVTKRDALNVRIDQSSKFPVTTFLRAMDKAYGTTDALIREFYETEKVDPDAVKPQMYAVTAIVDPESGEELVPAGGQIGDAVTRIAIMGRGAVAGVIEAIPASKPRAEALVTEDAKDVGEFLNAAFPCIRTPEHQQKVRELRSKHVVEIAKILVDGGPIDAGRLKGFREKIREEIESAWESEKPSRKDIDSAFAAEYLQNSPGFEFKVFKTDKKGEFLSSDEIEAIESELLKEYADEELGMKFPRLNSKAGKAGKVEMPDGVRPSDKGWTPITDINKVKTDLLSDETLSQGVYFLRPRGEKLQHGYIGIGGRDKKTKPDPQNVGSRLALHIGTGNLGVKNDEGRWQGTDSSFLLAIAVDWELRLHLKIAEGLAETWRTLRPKLAKTREQRPSHREQDEGIEVISKAADPLMLNTLAEDAADAFESALLRLYARLRPGNPPQLDKAQTLFKEKFFDGNRYRLGKVGRFRLNRKFNQDVPESVMTLRPSDMINTIKYIIRLRGGEGVADDIDHLGNRRLRTIDELAADELRKGLLKLRRTVQERMSLKEPDQLNKIADLINSKSVSSSIEFFFGRSELSQVVDQTNPLSQLTHERRLSALGPGGLNRKRAGFEVRDVHISHYGRICPVETPEGNNIGLISSLSLYATVDEYGFLTTPYRIVKNRRVTDEVKWLRADEESEAVLAPPDVLETDQTGRARPKLPDKPVLARAKSEVTQVNSDLVQYLDVSPKQTMGVSAALIPFLEHDDANRALMGSNMQRQAVPLIRTEPALVATGLEKYVAQNSGMVVRARKDGTVTYADALRIVIDNVDEYELRKFARLNERTCLNQRPSVRVGQRVKKGEIIADGPGCAQGELALGRNVLVAFVPFDGYNFEDAILLSERLVKNDAFTSIHIEEYEVEIRETKLGREEFTRDIPNVSEKSLRNLDASGVIRIGTPIKAGDILVGKVAPKSKSELTPEEKLLHAIFGRAGEEVKNDSLELPAGEEGVVIAAQRFSRRVQMSDDQKKALSKAMKEYEARMNLKAINAFRTMCAEINEVLGEPMVDPSTRQKVGQSDIDAVVTEQIENFQPRWIKGGKASDRERAEGIHHRYWPLIEDIRREKARKLGHMKRGDELPSGVLEMVKVYVATKRRLSVGDKMAGRHGNKGVIARILPEEDMPFLADGTAVDICLNPLGVPSRMNVGQILETHLGWAAAVLGFKAITPVFDGAKEGEIFQHIEQANEHVRKRREDLQVIQQAGVARELLVEMPLDGKIVLYDGRTGEPFEQKVTVGYMYLNKLHHLVDDKIHARSTGPYSLITQQPLGGKARTGGQRFGEMEVWALESYGASYTLQEMLTVKSDDVEGRTKIYESMVKGNNTLDAGTPVSFDVLCNELRGLGLNIQLEKKGLI